MAGQHDETAAAGKSKSGSGSEREGNNNRFEMAYNPPPSIGTGGEGRDGRFNLTPQEKIDLSKGINLSQRTGSYVNSLGMYKPKNAVLNAFNKTLYGKLLSPFIKMDTNLRKKRTKYINSLGTNVLNPNEMTTLDDDETYMDLTKGINLAEGNMLSQSEFERLMNYQNNNPKDDGSLQPYLPINYNTGAATTEDVEPYNQFTYDENAFGPGGEAKDVRLGTYNFNQGGRAGKAESGIMGLRARRAFGGIMDRVTGRKAYGLGSIFKSVKKAVGKVLSSDIGKAAIIGAGIYYGGGGTFKPGGSSTFSWGLGNTAAGKGFFSKGNPLLFSAGTGKNLGKQVFNPWKMAGLITAGGALMGPAKVDTLPGMNNRGGSLIDPITGKPAKPAEMRASLNNALDNADGDPVRIKQINDAYAFLGPDERLGTFEPYRTYGVKDGGRIGKAEGGLMDLGGMEKDYRAEGGFVPIGEYEKKDDVPARLSVNEFVFTADAVRGAGGGDIDKGAEIMENMMVNLEKGGTVSEESQGNAGAQQMFDTSERLGEVI